MEGVKAKIHGDSVESSVEFSVEEVITQHHGKSWGEMSPEEQEAALKDYALSLFSRENGVYGNFQVDLEGGTFNKGQA